MNESRQLLLSLLSDLSEEAPDLRMGQLVANLATLAKGPQTEATWDAEDHEFISAATRLLEHYRQRNAAVESLAGRESTDPIAEHSSSGHP